MDLYGDDHLYAAERSEEVQILNPLKLTSLRMNQISKAGNPVSGWIFGISTRHPTTDRKSKQSI